MDEKIYDPFEESKRNRWPKIGIIYSKEGREYLKNTFL